MGLGTEPGEFLDRFREHSDSGRGSTQCQTVRQREGLAEGHAGEIESGPSELDTPAVGRVAEGLRSKMSANTFPAGCYANGTH